MIKQKISQEVLNQSFLNISDLYYEKAEEIQDSSNVEENKIKEYEVQEIPEPLVKKSSSKVSEQLELSIVDSLSIIVSHKLKISLEQVDINKSLKMLVSGKSTLQNEILSDMLAEYGDVIPEKSENLSLKDVSTKIDESYDRKPGKFLKSEVSKFLIGKLPQGFSKEKIQEFCNSKYGLNADSTDIILAYMIVNESPKRLLESELISLIESSFSLFVKRNNVVFKSFEEKKTAVVSSAEVENIVKDQRALYSDMMNLYAKHMNVDLNKYLLKFHKISDEADVLQSTIDFHYSELGEYFVNSMKPKFDKFKVRTFDSHWNWVLQDITRMKYDCLFGKITEVNREIMAECIHIINRATPKLINYMKYILEQKYDSYSDDLLHIFGETLTNNCIDGLKKDPVYKNVLYPMAPKTLIEDGKIFYSEVKRNSIRKMASFVEDMEEKTNYLGSHITPALLLMMQQKNISEDLLNNMRLLLAHESSKPLLSLRSGPTDLTNSVYLTEAYFKVLNEAAK